MTGRLDDLIISIFGGVISYIIIQLVKILFFGLSFSSITSYDFFDLSTAAIMSLYFLVIIGLWIRLEADSPISMSVILATLALIISVLISIPIGFIISEAIAPSSEASRVFVGGTMNISFQTSFYSVLFFCMCFWAVAAIFMQHEEDDI